MTSAWFFWEVTIIHVVVNREGRQRKGANLQTFYNSLMDISQASGFWASRQDSTPATTLSLFSKQFPPWLWNNTLLLPFLLLLLSLFCRFIFFHSAFRWMEAPRLIPRPTSSLIHCSLPWKSLWPLSPVINVWLVATKSPALAGMGSGSCHFLPA